MLKLMVELGLLNSGDSRELGKVALKKIRFILHNWKTFPFSHASVNVAFPLGNDVFLHFRGSANTIQHVTSQHQVNANM